MPLFSSKNILFCFALILSALPGFAQRYGNEWINFDQQYFKIPVAQNGIYRITKTDLLNAGFQANSVDPRKIQLFHRGVEQAITINGESDALFDDSDYIEFYGEKNDGTLDSLLYFNPANQPNKYYNLYSDTAAYFLTYPLDNQLGKRMSVFQESNAGLPTESYHYDKKLILNTSVYSGGQQYPSGSDIISFWSQYDQGEGWTGVLIPKGGSLDYTFTGINNANTSAIEKPKLEVQIKGVYNLPHIVEVLVVTPSGTERSLGVVALNYFNDKVFSSSIEWTDFSSDGKLVIRTRCNTIFPTDYICVSYLLLTYPQQFNQAALPQKEFNLEINNNNKSYVEITNPVSGTTLYDLSDKDNILQIGTTTQSGKLTAIVPGTSVSKNILANSGFLPVLSIAKTGFRQIDPLQHSYLIISHKGIRKPVLGISDPVKAYSDYRASAAGGNYDTLVVNIDQLYNQFSYGERTALAIRHFADFMLQNSSKQLYLFLIGRGCLSYLSRNVTYPNIVDAIPTGGFPGSDVCLTSGLQGNYISVPSIPTGRLVADKPEHVINYLNKVKEHEGLEPQLWRKNLIHLSGGHSEYEFQLFRQYVDDFKRIAEGEYLGGKVVETISKTNYNSETEFLNIANKVNDGVNLITFFGHSAETGTDINIGYISDPTNGYNNKGKYPMIFVNGCSAGNIFNDNTQNLSRTISFGEDWMRSADKGSIAFLAHSYEGYATSLKVYADQFYKTAFADSIYIGKPIGVIHREIVRRFTDIFTNMSDDSKPFYLSNAQQYVLQGDPALSITNIKKPDYAISSEKLFLKVFNNDQLTAAVDSFQVGIIVSNLGRTDTKQISVTVFRTFSDGTTQAYDTLFYPPVSFQDTIYFTIKNKNFIGAGNNKFEVKVDVLNEIDETNENNNTATLEFVIPLVGAIPLFPREYSVVNKQPVTFVAQATSGVSGATRQYVMELDTTDTFASPGKKTLTTTALSLPTWTSDLIVNKDSVVYYWRVRFADIPEGVNNAWSESSFIYINNSPEGWSQSDFPQFSKATLNNTVRNTELEKWEFVTSSLQINLKLNGTLQGNGYLDNELYFNNSKIVSNGICGNNSIIAVAFNKSTLVPYHVFGNANICGVAPSYAMYLSDGNIISNKSFEVYIDAVHPGDYILFFTSGDISFNSLPASSFQKLVDIGADINNLNKLRNGDPYIILGQKGATPATAIEVLGDYTALNPPRTQILVLSKLLSGGANKGTIQSSLIGPASEWGTLFRDIRGIPNSTSEQWSLDLLGVDLQGKENLILQNVPTDAFQLGFVNVNTDPYLRLRLNVEDTVKQVPPQLKRWQVIYKGVPEGIINRDFVSADVYKITNKYAGESISIPFVFQNISNLNFGDSLTIQYSLINKTTGIRTTKSFKVKKLLAQDTVHFTISTTFLNANAGDNILQVYVNPKILPEENYVNNILEIAFTIDKDNANPILDVTFDGIKIMNGDIVSPTPLIELSLKDENKFLLKQDTTGLEIYLTSPCNTGNCQPQRISLSSSEVRWTPAGSDNNFRLEYKPSKKLTDGTYTLRVQGTDVSGNKSSIEPSYQITFDVVNEASVTHFYPYPNPFSTSTRFVFTLTGSQIPDQIKIQIMTITGKVVKEIFQDELGPIRIGNNISQYAWDGKDEFGDKLANGVYLYRVVMKNSNGEALNLRSTAGDKSFNKDFGKIYILR